jgi:hypothetical protein
MHIPSNNYPSRVWTPGNSSGSLGCSIAMKRDSSGSLASADTADLSQDHVAPLLDATTGLLYEPRCASATACV